MQVDEAAAFKRFQQLRAKHQALLVHPLASLHIFQPCAISFRASLQG